jgi:ABC-2 type transport system permease protein
LLALVFIGAYYFFYFKASDLLRDLLLNASVYGEKIKGAAYGLYLFGRIGEGDWLAAALYAAVTAALFALVWFLMSRSFLQIATSTGNTEKQRYVEKAAKLRSPFSALLAKEFGRFTSSANYMLNTGLGVLLIPALGVLLLVKGRELCAVLGEVFAARPGTVAVLLCTMLCTLVSMNDMAVPSVSLEGKSLWIPQSLPLESKTVLRAKLSVQLILTLLPMLFASLCAALISDETPAVRLLLVLMPMVFAMFWSQLGLFVGVRMPLLNWTDETAPIKQSGAILIVIFGAWGVAAALAGFYLLIGYKLGATAYLTIWTVLLAVGSLLLLRWMNGRGAREFEEL